MVESQSLRKETELGGNGERSVGSKESWMIGCTRRRKREKETWSAVGPPLQPTPQPQVARGVGRRGGRGLEAWLCVARARESQIAPID